MDLWAFALKLFFSVVGAVLPPLGMRLLAELFPPRPHRLFPSLESLRARNGWINAIACILFVGGFFLPFLLLRDQVNEIGWPVIGLGFGGAVVVAYAWICLATLPFGLWRYQEFWRYEQLHNGVGAAGLYVIFVPPAAFGILSAIVVLGGDWAVP